MSGVDYMTSERLKYARELVRNVEGDNQGPVRRNSLDRLLAVAAVNHDRVTLAYFLGYSDALGLKLERTAEEALAVLGYVGVNQQELRDV